MGTPTCSLIATGHPLATQAGAKVHALGGNAFDIAVAAGLAQCVVEPLLSGLGGGGYAVSFDHQHGYRAWDFFVDFPGKGLPGTSKAFAEDLEVDFLGASQSFKIGPGSIAAPGTWEGLKALHQSGGRLSLAQVAAPAIEYAYGHKLNATQSRAILILKRIASYDSVGRALYFHKNGACRREGEELRNPELGNFILSSVRGGGAFRSPPLVESVLSRTRGVSSLNAADFTQYKVQVAEPLVWKYRDHVLYSTPEPNLGGVFLRRMLKDLESYDLSSTKWGSSEHIGILAQVLKRAEEQAQVLEQSFKKGTTHLSVSDAEGNLLSVSLSNGEGSGCFVPGTGVMLNNMMGEDDILGPDESLWRCGTRLPSRMSPLILRAPNGRAYVLGTGGSKRIRSSLFTVVSHLVDFGKSLEQALLAPRMNWDEGCLQMEPGFASSSVDALRSQIKVNLWKDIAFFFGGVHGVLEGGEAIADPRRCGSAQTL